MTRGCAFVAVAVIATVVTAGAQKQTPVPVFVTSVGAVQGFTDPSKDNLDTVKDLRNAIKEYKALVLTDKRDEAVIVLVVMSRELKRWGEGAILHVKLQFKDMDTEMSGSSWRSWSKAADEIAKQVEQWVIANRTKLTEAAR